MTKKFLAPPLNEDDAVFQEVIDSLRLTESVFGLKKAVEAVIDTAMRKTASDGVPRKVGGLFRTFVTIKGKVPNGDSSFAALTGKGADGSIEGRFDRNTSSRPDGDWWGQPYSARLIPVSRRGSYGQPTGQP